MRGNGDHAQGTRGKACHLLSFWSARHLPIHSHNSTIISSPYPQAAPLTPPPQRKATHWPTAKSAFSHRRHPIHPRPRMRHIEHTQNQPQNAENARRVGELQSGQGFIAQLLASRLPSSNLQRSRDVQRLRRSPSCIGLGSALFERSSLALLSHAIPADASRGAAPPKSL